MPHVGGEVGFGDVRDGEDLVRESSRGENGFFGVARGGGGGGVGCVGGARGLEVGGGDGDGGGAVGGVAAAVVGVSGVVVVFVGLFLGGIL